MNVLVKLRPFEDYLKFRKEPLETFYECLQLIKKSRIDGLNRFPLAIHKSKAKFNYIFQENMNKIGAKCICVLCA